MPLKTGTSPQAFSYNVKTEMAHGKPQKQAVVIAYAQKKKSKRGSYDAQTVNKALNRR